MKPDWTLIANATHARLLQQLKGEPMVIIHSFSHPQSRSRISDLADDRLGHESADGSYGGTSFQPRVDAKEKEHLRFAREIAEYVEGQAKQNSFKALTVFSSNPFLGELKAMLGPNTQRQLAGTHDLDLTSVGPTELEKRIAHELAA
jgi:protein required for attachment to host cells